MAKCLEATEPTVYHAEVARQHDVSSSRHVAMALFEVLVRARAIVKLVCKSRKLSECYYEDLSKTTMVPD